MKLLGLLYTDYITNRLEKKTYFILYIILLLNSAKLSLFFSKLILISVHELFKQHVLFLSMHQWYHKTKCILSSRLKAYGNILKDNNNVTFVNLKLSDSFNFSDLTMVLKSKAKAKMKNKLLKISRHYLYWHRWIN